VTSVSAPVSDRTVDVAHRSIHLLEAGSGEPLVVFHHSTGNLGWIELYRRLSDSFTVIVPDLPGYGRSELPEWAESVADLAVLMNAAIRRLDLGPVHLVGLGLGGFVAAEMAVLGGDQLASLTLVGAPGLKPREGEIVDQVVIGFEEYVRLGFADPARFDELFDTEAKDAASQIWDASRVMTCRVAWKPWMWSRQLPHLLCEVTTSTLVVWGDSDRVVPIDCGRRYVEELANAHLEVIADAGHVLDLERPGELSALIADHARTTNASR
jgi:pimeloyl-ACP methyl ester carboxylesterase